MKRLSICLIAAVAILALAAMPAMACNGTVGKAYKAKSDVDYWEQCYYIDPQYDSVIPVGPAYHFATQTQGGDVIIHYVGEQDFTATDRINRDRVHKVTWNRHVDGTAMIYAPYGTGTFAAMAMRAPQLAVQAQDHSGSIFPLTCYPLPVPPDTTNAVLLYSGPFVIKEVVKDIGNDAACFDANNPAPTSFADCLMKADGPWQDGLWNKIEYLNYHAKITGKQRVYNWTMEIREPGKICFEDRDGYDKCYLFGTDWPPVQ